MEIWGMTLDLRILGAVLFGLIAFGYGYNRWVERLEMAGHDRGYMSLIVALGCLVTIIGYVLISWQLQEGLLILLCFVCSGTPMIAGSIVRHVRAQEQERLRTHHDAEEQLR